jgi:hypothetical protein
LSYLVETLVSAACEAIRNPAAITSDVHRS